MSSKPDNGSLPGFRWKPGRKFYVFLVSLLIAAGFWLLNALSKTYVEELPVRIKYVNIPEGETYSQPVLSEVLVSVEGDGYNILQLKRALRNDSVIIDLSECRMASIRGGRKKGLVPSWWISDELKNEFGNGMNISKISVDSIVVVTENKSKKDLLVHPRVTLNLANGYILKSPPVIIPELVRVTGPASLLNNLDSINTEYFETDLLSDSVDFTLKLAPENVTLVPALSSVEMHVDIEPLTEGSFTIPISVKHMPKGKSLRLIPSDVEVKFTTGLSAFDQMDPTQFLASVDYRDVKNNPSRLLVTIEVKPEKATVLFLSPERVEYLIIED